MARLTECLQRAEDGASSGRVNVERRAAQLEVREALVATRAEDVRRELEAKAAREHSELQARPPLTSSLGPGGAHETLQGPSISPDLPSISPHLP